VEWSGVEWSGVEWSGVEWSGVEWSGEEWSGVPHQHVHHEEEDPDTEGAGLGRHNLYDDGEEDGKPEQRATRLELAAAHQVSARK
jgi:hypothetical protein